MSIVNEVLYSMLAVGGIMGIALLIGLVFNGIARKAGASKAQQHSIRDVIFAIAGVFSSIAVLSTLSLSSQFETLAASGIIGFLIATSFQSTLSNVISGILFLHDGAIKVGDDIQTPNFRGKVMQFSLRTTWFDTEDGSIVIVANSTLSGTTITNHTLKERMKQ